jgi:hypothetical protein
VVKCLARRSVYKSIDKVHKPFKQLRVAIIGFEVITDLTERPLCPQVRGFAVRANIIYIKIEYSSTAEAFGQ